MTVSNEKRTPNYFMFGARLQLFVTFNSVTQIDLTPNAAVTPDETQRSGEIRQYFMKTLQINVASVTFFFLNSLAAIMPPHIPADPMLRLRSGPSRVPPLSFPSPHKRSLHLLGLDMPTGLGTGSEPLQFDEDVDN